MTEQADLVAPEAEHRSRSAGKSPEGPLPRAGQRWPWHVASALAIVVAPPGLAGALLLFEGLELRRRANARFSLGFRSTTSALDGWLDLGLGAAFSVSLAAGSLHASSAGRLYWLPLVLAALALCIRTSLPDKTEASHARIWLGTALLLTPLASLSGTALAANWSITSYVVWFLVHLLALGRWLLTRLDPRGVTEQFRVAFLGKGSAFRNATAAAIATGIDFAVYSALVSWAVAPPVATLAGATAGGVLNFSMNRSWAFSATGRRRTMVRRYFMVSGASALLNASFVLALLWLPQGRPTVAWVCARCLVFLGWNYPLQRDYVFAHRNSRDA